MPAGIPHVRVSRHVDAPAERVWDLLVDLDRWPAWGPSVAGAVLEVPTGVRLTPRRLHDGATGRVRTAVGVWLPFRVTAFEDGRSWAWDVAGLPATTHSVEPAGTGCRVTFGVPLVAAPYAAVCRVALGRIERLARHP